MAGSSGPAHHLPVCEISPCCVEKRRQKRRHRPVCCGDWTGRRAGRRRRGEAWGSGGCPLQDAFLWGLKAEGSAGGSLGLAKASVIGSRRPVRAAWASLGSESPAAAQAGGSWEEPAGSGAAGECGRVAWGRPPSIQSRNLGRDPKTQAAERTPPGHSLGRRRGSLWHLNPLCGLPGPWVATRTLVNG